ncbi:hypothetical protein N9M28_05010 [Luminiphilus sp.]|nr:hypothetical protein [Luminiphilus sp.]
MDKSAIQKLQAIESFEGLVEYLGDELDWPVADLDFEDLIFQYTPEEIGLDEKSAAVVTDIKRLRPLDDDQPWGIFFLELEPKKLPVVALRRLLHKMTLKQRATSNAATQTAWHADDILFISRFGESQERQLTFAHFASPENKKHLPVLKVLGWDSGDTALKMDHVAETLKEKLVWPDDPTDTENWREQWRAAFELKHKEVISTSKDMASRLAQLARGIRDSIQAILKVESEEGPLRQTMAAFKAALIDDLDEAGFADTYAQTITYGLLSARIADPTKNTLDDLAAHMRTNPFLKELMESFINLGGRERTEGGVGLDFDELGVAEVVDVLDTANIRAVLRDFGDLNPQEDPVIHFFEGFLQEYDKSIRKDRGVFYSPRPLVSFIVRSVHEQLRTEFGLEDGLADTTTWGEIVCRIDDLEIPAGATPDQAFVQILDPATGTGTFLVEVIDLIHKTMTAKWESDGYVANELNEFWNGYVTEHLLPRLHGYELMMAPYAIAHMKIGLKLSGTGYRFDGDERARVYLTNALEPAQDFSGALDFAIPALAHEAEAVNAIKRDQRFTVVIGNPPYSGFSANMNSWIDDLLKGKLPDGRAAASYYEVEGAPLKERKLWLQDDYVKFIRLSQFLIAGSSVGILGFITNNSYLDGPTHRGMRFQLWEFFSKITLTNLHGSLKRNQDRSDARTDENVFDIQQGVAVGIYTRRATHRDQDVLSNDVRGSRIEKYAWLMKPEAASSAPVLPTTPWFLFVPSVDSGAADYDTFVSLRDIFEIKSTSVQTSRDSYVVDFEPDSLRQRVAELGDLSRPDSYFREEFGLKDGRNWKLREARADISGNSDWAEAITPYLYRAFDVRSIAYRDSLVNWPRHDVMDHLSDSNVALLVPRQLAGEEFKHAFCTRILCDMCVVSTATKEAVQAYPLWLAQPSSLLGQENHGGQSNLADSFVRNVESRVSLEFSSARKGGFTSAPCFGPQECFGYIYAILYSPNYRFIYRQFLKLDFPRIPYPGSADLFIELAALGSQLADLHLLKSVFLNEPIACCVGEGDFQVEGVSYSDETAWIDKAKTRGFKGLSEEVWNFRVGGYQVCERWLKDRQAKGGKNSRPGRVLTDEDIEHYKQIVVALSETIRIMAEIDEVIEAHGGWPGAFFTANGVLSEAPSPAEAAAQQPDMI